MGRGVGRQGSRARPEKTVKAPVLLDSSFLIDLERETSAGTIGPARSFLPSLRGRKLVVSVVTVAEILEGAADQATTLAALKRFTIQGLHFAQAERCALIQRRARHRMGENDAWIVGTAQSLDADVVGTDRPAFARLREKYLRYR